MAATSDEGITMHLLRFYDYRKIKHIERDLWRGREFRQALPQEVVRFEHDHS